MLADVVPPLPKVVLHDHLDGGLRPQTVLDLADEVGYGGLPTHDPADLAAWFRAGADRGDLVAYLEGFAHTCAVMQTTDALHRVAREFVTDLAADGVVYAEVRFAPHLHTGAGLTVDDVLEAVIDGLTSAGAELGVGVGTIATGLRTWDPARVVAAAEAAVRWRDRGVVGFDLAGAEAGHPCVDHLEAFRVCHLGHLPVTIHAGEADGPASISAALHPCGANRIGHGVRIIDEVSGTPDAPMLSPLARYVRDTGVTLELCPTSNIHTGAVGSLADHPIGTLRDLGFRVTLNTDDRLMSGVTVTSEMVDVAAAQGWGLAELAELTETALSATFLDPRQQRHLRDTVIRPRWTQALEAAAWRPA